VTEPTPSNAGAEPAPESAPSAPTKRKRRISWRRIVSPLCTVLASILLFVSVLAIWINFSALDTDEFAETSTEILADPDVQTVLAPFIVNEAFSSLPIGQDIGKSLPPALQPLAGTVASAVEDFAVRQVQRLLDTKTFQDLWKAASTEAHNEFLALVEGNTEAVTTTGGQVVLDLRPMTARVFERLGLDPTLVDRIPEGRGQIVVMQDSQLTAVQKLVNVLQKTAKWLWVFPILLYAAAIWLARGRRREAIRGVGLSWLIVGLGLVLLVRLGGPRVIETLVAVPENKPAALSVWQILTANLRDSARALLLVGAIILVGTWLVGPGRWATSVRHWAAPFMRKPALVYGAVAIFTLLILLFVPLRENRSLFSTLIFLTALVVGVEVVRRITMREFPEEDAVEGDSPEPPVAGGTTTGT
jgi:hypothetical protein